MRSYFSVIILLTAFSLCSSAKETSPGVLVDPKATPETVTLYQNLKYIAKEHMLFGQYRAYTRGKHAQPEEERESNPDFNQTDTKTLVGQHPAVIEFGLHKPEVYDYWIKLAPELHRRGVLISLSSHSRNPDLEIPYNHSHKDNRGDPVRKVIDRSSPDHKAYMEVLRSYGEFIKRLKDDQGRPIPVLLRLYHEHSGGWFWWGTKTCTPEEFNELWKMTFHFFRDEMEIHNAIYVLSPSKPTSVEKYLARFPGPEYVDVIGFDCYAAEDLPHLLLASARATCELARKYDKVAAITEFGFRKGFNSETDVEFYTKAFLENLKTDPLANEVAFALTWFGREPRDDIESGNWSPYPDEPTSKHVFPDFVKFHQDPWTVFEGDLPSLYQTRD
ncbi:MAG: glycosyl hydrolase [Verrucomicrobiota bacterium]